MQEGKGLRSRIKYTVKNNKNYIKKLLHLLSEYQYTIKHVSRKYWKRYIKLSKQESG